LRRAEIVGLDVADVIDGGRSLRVRGKGNKERIVYLPEGAVNVLSNWLSYRGNTTGPLFCATSRKGEPQRPLAEQTVYDVLRALGRTAGIAVVAPHDLRRTFVSMLLDQGVSLSTVSALAGHASVSTTATYDRRGERAKREAVKVLGFPSRLVGWPRP
jgi:site-specific recombinase XerD